MLRLAFSFCLCMATACSGGSAREAFVERAEEAPTRQQVTPLIDGDLAPLESGVVWLSHPAQPFVCSGTVVHPKLIVTTQHCVFASRPEGDSVLSAAGFRVGFGTSEEALVFRDVLEVEWVGAPATVPVGSAVEMGQDVAVLYLGAAAPGGTHVHAIDWNYSAQAGQEFLMVGFGLSSITLGTAGTRRSATGIITGFAPATGVIQVQGRSACFGDSGGPLLLGPAQQWVGAISQIGGSSPEQFCDVGLTFGATLLNSGVRALLERAFERAESLGVSGAGGNLSAGGGAGGDAGAGGVAGVPSSAGGTRNTGSGGRPPVHVGTITPLAGTSSQGGGAGPHFGGFAGASSAGGKSVGAGHAASGAGMEAVQLSARGGCAVSNPSRRDNCPTPTVWTLAIVALLICRRRAHCRR